MTLTYRDDWLDIYLGDCRDVMAEMPEKSVHTVVTSPPYYSLRDYGLEATVWGGDPDHQHEWSAQNCGCGSWLGTLGNEPTPEQYCQNIVEVFRGVWRVLRDDGSLWLVLGDTYAANRTYVDGSGKKSVFRVPLGYKQKDLFGIPWMVAFALRSAGWYLRSDVVWNKSNAMPEPARDRPTRSHEFVFLLSKQEHYFYDNVAIKEPVGEGMRKAAARTTITYTGQYKHDESSRMGKTSPNRMWGDPETVARILEGRNKRDVWTVAYQPLKGGHAAAFPKNLIRPMILAGSSSGGVCEECGAPFVRTTKRINSDWQSSCGHTSLPKPATVFDPFAGSGTTAIVARESERRAILIDLNAEYVQQQYARNGRVS